ncbi:helix-turn-helix domain-containing protein [Mycolicibacterium farcinogenes]|uniref:Helix-turn-helix domain-containing protein n=1 Tax=Mycolicibacterium farcinogenes TaxID=1802 RepID=A0ACD1FQT0_MYCFR|nr:helix-turn-helix transcriptional regulator [Mycolicibacterium farcinogenes]QZH69414.1 helix-turn-helix domain-containing protein [Mycolicibacterium farcinogenes]
MLSCSERPDTITPGVAFGQRLWRGAAVTDTSSDDSVILAALGAAIRDHRLQAGLTQAELAERAGIGRPHLNHIEGGRKNPTAVVVVHIAQVLGVAPGELLAPSMPATGTGRP